MVTFQYSRAPSDHSPATHFLYQHSVPLHPGPPGGHIYHLLSAILDKNVFRYNFWFNRATTCWPIFNILLLRCEVGRWEPNSLNLHFLGNWLMSKWSNIQLPDPAITHCVQLDQLAIFLPHWDSDEWCLHWELCWMENARPGLLRREEINCQPETIYLLIRLKCRVLKKNWKAKNIKNRSF